LRISNLSRLNTLSRLRSEINRRNETRRAKVVKSDAVVGIDDNDDDDFDVGVPGLARSLARKGDWI